MAREDILGGLRSALIRGYSLKDAMVSFYNAGYKKADIENAARTLQYSSAQNKEIQELTNQKEGSVVVKTPEVAVKKPNLFKKPAPEAPPAPVETGKESPPQKPPESREAKEQTVKPVQHFKALHPQKPAIFRKEHGVEKKRENSYYPPPTGVRVATIILVIILLFLLGTLGTIFIFKSQILQFFNNLLT